MNPSVRVPLIFSEGLVLIGPNEDGIDAIIDTTSPDFSSLFEVDAENGTIFIVQEIDNFDFGDMDNLIDPINIDPVTFESGISQFTSQDFTAAYADSVGVYEGDAANAPMVPADMSSGEVFYPARTSDFLEKPDPTLLDLSASTVTEFELTTDQVNTNQLTFSLANNSGSTLTDGTFTPGTTPDVVLETETGNELFRSSFLTAPVHGETVAVTLDLSGMSIPATSRYRFDVGTAAGMAPILNNPVSLGLGAAVTTTRYAAFTLDHVAQQPNVDISQPAVTFSSDSDFDGAVTSSGMLSVAVFNDLPVPITIDQIVIENQLAVDQFPAGHVVASTFDHPIAARATRVIQIPIGVTGVSPQLAVTASATSAGTSSTVRILATDAINTDLDAALELQKIYIRPTAETIDQNGNVDFDVEDVTFNSNNDFIQLASGQLQIEQITNDLDIALSAVQVSFPGIRRAPFGTGDSLIISIPGGVSRNSSVANPVTVDLAGTRIYAPGNVIDYNLSAQSEAASDVRTIFDSDIVAGVFSATNLVADEVVGYINQFTLDLGVDANGDGFLDVLDEAEAQVTDLGLDEITSLGISNLQLVGSEITFELETDIATDFVLFGAFVGVAEDGSYSYLGGVGQNAVLQSDAHAQAFYSGVSQLMPDQLIKLGVKGATSAGKVVQRRMLLNESNSNVDEFISNLPEKIQFVGKALVQPGGGQVHLRDPFLLNAGLGITVPLAIRDSFSVDKNIDADLSSLADLTDPSSTIEIQVAEVNLDYTNYLPLGIATRFSFLDQNGDVLTVLPATSDPPIDIGSASTTDDGISLAPFEGVTTFRLTEEQLRIVSNSSSIELNMVVSSTDAGIGRVRATDKIELALSGNFDINVNVGGE